MKFFKAKKLPSEMTADDYASIVAKHENALYNARRAEHDAPMGVQMGMGGAIIGGMSGLGTIVAVGMGALSATALPIVLPFAATVGLAGLAMAAFNKIRESRAWQQGEEAKSGLQSTYANMKRFGITLPSLNGLGAKLDERSPAVETSVAPSVQRRMSV